MTPMGPMARATDPGHRPTEVCPHLPLVVDELQQPFGWRMRGVAVRPIVLGVSALMVRQEIPMPTDFSRFYCHRRAAFALVAALTLTGLPHSGNAQAKKANVAGLEGSWSGGGTAVSFASGAREQARCRARYSRAGNNSYTVNATCATASGRAAQTAIGAPGGREQVLGQLLQQRVCDLGRDAHRCAAEARPYA